MIGVVVWSNAAQEKAVIWCEDQASLAYLQGRQNLADPSYWPEPGDLLELASEMIGDLRHARAVSVLSEQGCPQLPHLLRTAPSDAQKSHLRLVSTGPDRGHEECLQSYHSAPLRSAVAR